MFVDTLNSIASLRQHCLLSTRLLQVEDGFLLNAVFRKPLVHEMASISVAREYLADASAQFY